MKKKRRVFDIDFEAAPDAPSDVNPAPAPDDRRGPMAAAISENAGALDARADAEAAIRAENDALAHEHVRLKKLGLITDLIPVSSVQMSKLKRDRVNTSNLDVSELVASIQAIGLSNPIVVDKTEDGYELIQGLRRLTAFRTLAESDTRYAQIPATMVPKGETLDTLYRKMVDENLIRQDVSFAEMALLAQEYAADQGGDVAAAVDLLFASAGRQKRAYIKNFARLLSGFNLPFQFPQAMPRALGLDILKACEASPDAAGMFEKALRLHPSETAATEVALLRKTLADVSKPATAPAKPVQGKTTLRIARSSGAVKCLASQGRLELQQDRDFGAVDRDRLERALDAFFATLDQG